MGYSIYARFKTKEEIERMWAFMQQHFRLPNVVFPSLGPHNYSRLARNDQPDAKHSGISYCSHKLAIGFDYNSGNMEREYAHQITCWMAQRSSYRKKWDGRTFSSFYYDGEEWLIVNEADVVSYGRDRLDKLKGWIRADEDGWHYPSGESYHFTIVKDYLWQLKWSPDEHANDADAVMVSPSFGMKCSRLIWEKAEALMKAEWDTLRAELKRLSALWAEATESVGVQ